MNAFDDGRVGLWAGKDFNSARCANAAKFADGMFTDIFLPNWGSQSAYTMVRGQLRPDGSYMKAQMYALPGEMSAHDFATKVYNDVVLRKPGVAELDIEPNSTNRTEAGGKYTEYIAETVGTFRSLAGWAAHFPLRINIPPYKGAYLPSIFDDPYLYASEQTYYGDMSRVAENEALLDLTVAGPVPDAKAALCYGVAAPDKDGVRRLCLPTLFYEGRVVRKLKRGLVFQDDLMADQGLL